MPTHREIQPFGPFIETIKKSEDREPIPHDSLLAQWMESQDPEERHSLALFAPANLDGGKCAQGARKCFFANGTGFNSPLAARDLPASFPLSQEE